MYQKAIKLVLKDLCKKSHKSYYIIADLSGMRRQTFYDIMTKDAELKKVKDIIGLCRCFGISPSTFFKMVEDKILLENVKN